MYPDISDFEIKLEKYTDIVINVGLNLQHEQRLFIIAESLDVAPFIRQLTKSAYRNNCKLVSVHWLDEELEKIRLENAPSNSFEEYPVWEVDAITKIIDNGDAVLTVFGKNPELLSGQNPDLLSIINRTKSKYLKVLNEYDEKNIVQWSVVCPPTLGWAKSVFPNDNHKKAYKKLWESVIEACKLNEADPLKYWQKKIELIETRKQHLNTKQYSSLHFLGIGTDLKVGLPTGHIWCGGNKKTQSGVVYSPCIPTEEVYTLPHRLKVDGTVTSTKPMSFQGNIINDFKLTFSKGKVIEHSAEKGLRMLENLLNTDMTSGYLGEVALVSNQSAISQMDFLFLNTLYDENASNHLAIGNAYRHTLRNGDTMSDEDFMHAGGNCSLIHVDFMVGSDKMDVFGVNNHGEKELIMSSGEWVFEK